MEDTSGQKCSNVLQRGASLDGGSGKSQNIIEALQVANKMGLKCIAFTGKDTTYLDKYCHKIISIPAVNTARIQEMHIMLGQMLCNSVEFKLGYCDLVKEESL